MYVINAEFRVNSTGRNPHGEVHKSTVIGPFQLRASAESINDRLHRIARKEWCFDIVEVTTLPDSSFWQTDHFIMDDEEYVLMGGLIELTDGSDCEKVGCTDAHYHVTD